jgi:CarD family transcriptional regulator
MYKVGDIVVHKRDICKITEIKTNYMFDADYYTLVPIEDGSLVIHTPVLDKRGLIRNIVSKENAEALIQKIPEIQVVEFEDDRALENRYITLIDSGKHDDLIKIIKTTYLRKEEKENCGKKVSEKDKNYFRLAEKLFYTEFSIALKMSYQDTKDYIENKVAELIK